MSLLQVDRLTKAFGTDVLFEPFSAQIASGDRIALIGDNGVGKSTLLHILLGDERPTGGEARRIGEVRATFLPQVARLEGEGTLIQAMERPLTELRKIEATLRELEHAMADNPEAMHRYDDLLHEFDRRGGYQIESRIRSGLRGVGFKESEFDKPVDQLSGGEAARAALARTLLETPDILLLDEPTNHLDFAALDWLEEELMGFPGALVLVSHDRHLLDQVTNRTWEIALGRVCVYRVGYGHSRNLRESDRARQLEAFEKQQQTVDKYKDFVRRKKAGGNVKQAKDREKKLERIERDLVEAPRDAKRISLRIRNGRPSGKRILQFRNLSIGFDAPLFRIPDLDLYRGEKVAIVGPNGCGKTTLLKAISGERAPLGGEAVVGHNVQFATYSQTQEGLHGTGTVLDAVLSRSQFTISEARGLLGAFLFSGDEVEKKMKSLSGGERSRVALALLSLIEGNALLFDEPTNHLDLASQEILEQALVAYDGTILLVSHDRALLEAVTTQVWAVEEGELTVHGHGYAEYRRRLAEAARQRASIVETEEKRPRSTSGPAAKRPERNDQATTIGAQERAVEAIEEIEARIEDLEAALVDASARGDAQEIARLSSEHKAAQAELRDLYARWEDLTAEEPTS